MKKLFAVLLLMLMVIIPVSVNAATSGVVGTNQNATWELDENGLFTISGKGEIPNFVESNLPWASVRNQIKTVVIEEGITSVGGTSFYKCVNLKNVYLPEGLKSIRTSAFSGCTSLGNINFPNSLEKIEKSAFYNCTAMTKIELPVNLTVMENWAFAYCSNVSEIIWRAETLDDLSESVRAFPNLGNNTSGIRVIFEDGVKRVPAYALYGVSGVISITLPDTLESIGVHAFEYTNFYSDSNNWNNNVLYIGKNLVKAKSIKGECTIKEGTRLISEYAFSGCSSMTAVNIPKSVEIISKFSFEKCDGLKNITVPFVGTTRESEENFKCIFGDNIPSTLASVTITDAQEISDFVFYDCSMIKSVSIGGNLSRIGAYAFSECEELSAITFSDTVTNVGEQAFYGTAYYNNSANWVNDALYLENILIEVKDSFVGEFLIKENTRCIADDAFYGCLNMSGVIIPKTVTHIGNRAFYNCDALTDITIPDGVFDIGVFAFANCDNLESVTMSESVKAIGNFAFSNCSRLKQVPENIEAIGESAFSYCKGLSDVSVENNTTYRMHYGCDGLKYVKINSGVNTVAPYSFSECVGIDTVIIPKSVTNIETGAFENCISLKTVKYEGTEDEWKNLKIAIRNENLYFANIVYNSPIPEKIIYVDVKASDGIFTVTPKGVTIGNEIIFVCYKDKKLSYVESATYSGSEMTFTPDKEYDKVKVLVWKSLGSMQPVCDYKEL